MSFISQGGEAKAHEELFSLPFQERGARRAFSGSSLIQAADITRLAGGEKHFVFAFFPFAPLVSDTPNRNENAIN